MISSDFKGGSQDIIEDRSNGFIVENDEELKAKLNLLLSNQQLIETLGQNNKIILQKFNQDLIVQQWKNLLNC